MGFESSCKNIKKFKITSAPIFIQISNFKVLFFSFLLFENVNLISLFYIYKPLITDEFTRASSNSANTYKVS